MKPFLLIQSRPEDETSDNEYQAFLRYCGLEAAQLQRWRIERDNLPEIDLDDWSGILVGGGPYDFTNPQKSDTQTRVERQLHGLLDQVVEADFPFLGACYGIGLLTTHQQGVISRTYSEPVGPVEITIIEDDPLLAGLNSPFVSLLGHKEACEVLPPSATLLATSAACPVQMFRLKHNVYATQFHPELDAEGLETRIRIYINHGYFKPEEADQLIATGREAVITEPMKILRNFVEIYSASQR